VTRKYGGSGLGLTIVKQLVELQKGKITVRSEENVGSTFIVLIPYAVGKANTIFTSTLASHKSQDNTFTRKLQVLLVEDNDINRLYAKSILKNWQCEVDIAENGLVAIEKVKSGEYDLVLMDIQMPVMDGYEATKSIRMLDGPQKNIPILALTANATKPDIERCISSGMNDYLPKPFTPDDLHRKIVVDLKIRPKTAKDETSEPQRIASYDLSYLRSISNNNEEFIDEMIQTFVQTMPGVLSQIRENLVEKNFEKVSRLAHQVKPSFTLLGIHDLRHTILFIEENGKAKTNLNELVKVTSQFIQSCEQLVVEFNAALKS
jgi:CheY-like chemotaxis protein